VERLAAVFGFAEEECCAITLAVHEALANIIRHAYQGRPDGPVELTCRGLENGLEFTLVDRGQPLDPAWVCARPLDDAAVGGSGTHIIRQPTARVDYEQRRGANQATLVK